MKLTNFKALTFDCYGTLIDWEAGIVRALTPLTARAPTTSREQILEAFAQHESSQQSETPTLPYAQLLSVVYKRLADSWDVDVTDEEAHAFGASVPNWPEFSDSVEALRYLGERYKLVVLSNVDHISFRGSNARLRIKFDAVYTAQDIGSYKPNDRNFEYMLRHLKDDFGFEKPEILHVAQSLFHDHEPANRAGLASAWIDRRHAQDGWGATMSPHRMPRFNFKFPDLAAFVRAHKKELQEQGVP